MSRRVDSILPIHLVQREVGEIYNDLQRIRWRIARLAEAIRLPPNASAMWAGDVPQTRETSVHSGLEMVRVDCLPEILDVLETTAFDTSTPVFGGPWPRDRESEQGDPQ